MHTFNIGNIQHMQTWAKIFLKPYGYAHSTPAPIKLMLSSPKRACTINRISDFTPNVA